MIILDRFKKERHFLLFGELLSNDILKFVL